MRNLAGDGVGFRAIKVKRGGWLPFLFVVPTMTVLAVVALVPTVDAINIALQDRELSKPETHYVWLANFIALFDDGRFLHSMWVSLLWEILTVSATMIVAIPLAVLVFEGVGQRVRDALCVLLIVPVLLPRVSAAYVWKFAFHPLYGIVAYPLKLATGPPCRSLIRSTHRDGDRRHCRRVAVGPVVFGHHRETA